jgi:CheY-like chemotaxis protein
LRILVVEDEHKVARALKEGLEGEHYEVAVAESGEDAFFRVTTEQFDMILDDMKSPLYAVS